MSQPDKEEREPTDDPIEVERRSWGPDDFEVQPPDDDAEDDQA